MENSLDIQSKAPPKQIIISTLKKIQTVYHVLFNLSFEDRERTILKGYSMIYKKEGSALSNKAHLAIEALLNKYPSPAYPHDNVLIDLLKKDCPSLGIPDNDYDQLIFLYRWTNNSIENMFEKIEHLLSEKTDIAWVRHLKKTIRNILVDNPNFKTSSEHSLPYYKRNMSELFQAQKTWLSCLDDDFQSLIDYFEEVLEV